jgi:hypothetical protein
MGDDERRLTAERRSGEDRRSGARTKSGEEKPSIEERRSNKDRRSDLDRRSKTPARKMKSGDTDQSKLGAHALARQKLHEAVNALVGDKGMQMRLTIAASHLLILRQQLDLPGELKGRFESIIRTLAEEPLDTDQGYALRLISNEKSAEVAREILSLYAQVIVGL